MPIEVSDKALAAVTDFSYFSGVHPDESYDVVLFKQSMNAPSQFFPVHSVLQAYDFMPVDSNF